MDITLINGTTLTITPDDDSHRYAELTGDDRLEVRFSLAVHAEIPPGSSTVFRGVTYYVEDPEDVTIVHRRDYEYVVNMYTVAARLKRIAYINPDDSRVTFPVTGDATDHLTLIVRSANLLGNLQWTVGSVLSNTGDKSVSFDCCTLWEALEAVAEVFSTEFGFSGTTINLGPQEYNKQQPLTLQYGINKGLTSGIRRENLDNGSLLVAMAVKGSDRNINTSSNTGAYGAKTLHMPAEISAGVPWVLLYDGEKFGYVSMTSQGGGHTNYYYEYETGFNPAGLELIDTYVIGNGGTILQWCGKLDASGRQRPLEHIMPATYGTTVRTEDLTDIYPELTHTVTAVETATVTPHGGGDPYTQYTIDCGTSIDYYSLRIPGEKMSVIFKSGMLTGKEFDVSFSTQTHKFTIVATTIDDQLMPGGLYIPAVGDTFRVFGCQLPDEYIRQDSDHTGAEWRMAKEAVRRMHPLTRREYSWRADFDGIFGSNLSDEWFAKIIPGGYVSFTDPSVQPDALLIRITAIKQPLNHPKWPSITLSDRSRLRWRVRRRLKEESESRIAVNELQEQTHSNGYNVSQAQKEIGDVSSSAVRIFSDIGDVGDTASRVNVVFENSGQQTLRAQDGVQSLDVNADIRNSGENVLMIDNSDNTEDIDVQFGDMTADGVVVSRITAPDNVTVPAGGCTRIAIIVPDTDSREKEMDIVVHSDVRVVRDNSAWFKPLTFKALENGVKVGLKATSESLAKTIQYSTDGETWIDFTSSAETAYMDAVLGAGDVLYVKGNNSAYADTANYNYFVATGKFDLSGNLMSLIDGDKPEAVSTLQAYALRRIFVQAPVVDAGGLVLTAKKVGTDGYNSVFLQCSDLVRMPLIIAEDVGATGMYSMFNSCFNLVYAQDVRVKVMRDYCAQNMFYGCSSMVAGPAFLAENIGNGCMRMSFAECTLLSSVTLHATTLGNYALELWLRGVAASGTLTCPQTIQLAAGESGLPAGWTRIDL
jgi:hypothetical protein